MTLNEKSCLLDSFAYILCVDPEHLASDISYSGEEGYHTQELIEYCIKKGYCVVEIQRHPTAITIEGVTRAVNFEPDNETRFINHLKGTYGVLTGIKPVSLRPHAVPWVNGSIVDTHTNLFYNLIDNGRIKSGFFVPLTFLRISRWNTLLT